MFDTDEVQVSVNVFDGAGDVREAWANPEDLNLASVLGALAERLGVEVEDLDVTPGEGENAFTVDLSGDWHAKVSADSGANLFAFAHGFEDGQFMSEARDGFRFNGLDEWREQCAASYPGGEDEYVLGHGVAY